MAMHILNHSFFAQEPPKPKAEKTEFQIGSYDEGTFDLSDQVTVQKKQSFKTRAEAEAFAKSNPGAELITERIKEGQGLGYDVYTVKIHDQGQELKTGKEMEHLKLFDNPVKQISSQTGMRTQRAFFVTADGQVQANIYSKDFNRTVYDRARSALDLDHNETYWFNLVDKYMSAPSPADAIPNIENAEIQNLKSKLKPGDIIMTGNNGSFIHAITYVGEDKELQAQLEKKWRMAPGTLDGEGMILHSLAADHDAVIEVDGKKELRLAGGTGVIIDTIEKYNERNPRDTMIAVEVKGATEADRKAVIAEGKRLVGKGYDNGFNTFDDEFIYCTEFVYKSWMAAPDKNPKFDTQLHALVPSPSLIGMVPFSDKLMDKLPEAMKERLGDRGILYQEMIMTDGIITNPNVEIKWANQNADRSEFFQKHQRWADGYAGKISKGYQALLQENVPAQASRSQELTEKIKAFAAKTRAEMATGK